MTELMKLIFDAYSRQARLYPALLTLLPAAATIGALWPVVLTPTTLHGVAGIAIACGMLYGLASFARSRGKRTEKRLLASWGAWPTTIWLRHGSTFVQPPTLVRYHQFLQAHVPGWVLPTKADEQADLAKADSYYASAIEWLKEQCRGKDFPLVEKENAEYGFRRNLRGLRLIGITVCLVGIATAIAILEYRFGYSQTASGFFHPRYLWNLLNQSAASAAVLLNLLGLLGWGAIVNDEWVREAADQYARALLANCDGLKPSPATATTTPAAAATQP